MKTNYLKYYLNSIILLILLFGIKEIFYSVSSLNSTSALINPDYLYLERIISFIIGITFVFVARGLFNRIKVAWLISVITFPIIIIVNLLEKLYLNFSTFLAIYILLSIFLSKRTFNKPSNNLNIKKGVLISLVLFIYNVVFGAIYLYLHQSNFPEIKNFLVSFFISLKLVLSINKTLINSSSLISNSILEALIVSNVIGVFLIVYLVIKPILWKPTIFQDGKQKIQDLISKHSHNPISSIVLEGDKEYFFSDEIEGVIGYKVVKNVAVVAGEPICNSEVLGSFLREFKSFCYSNSLSICFCQITEKDRSTFENEGFRLQEYGKEAIISLADYSISGSKTAKIRWANNKMDKLGISINEYVPLSNRNFKIEASLHSISSEWLKMKRCSELSFTLGKLSFDNPYDRRFFYAIDSEGEILGFIVCFPYNLEKGYFIDITRRKHNAPLGIMEKLVIGTCELLKTEGIKEVSLGMAPLANIISDDDIQSKILHRIFEFIYENMNTFYGFKALYDYKKKYNPSRWEPRFIAYSTRIFTPQIGYAVITAKNPKGIIDFIFMAFKSVIRFPRIPLPQVKPKY